MRVLDEGKMRRFVAERKPIEVSAGILNDWSCTADTVYADGAWVKDSKACTSSSWATPGFKATMPNGDVVEVVAFIEED